MGNQPKPTKSFKIPRKINHREKAEQGHTTHHTTQRGMKAGRGQEHAGQGDRTRAQGEKAEQGHKAKHKGPRNEGTRQGQEHAAQGDRDRAPGREGKARPQSQTRDTTQRKRRHQAKAVKQIPAPAVLSGILIKSKNLRQNNWPPNRTNIVSNS